MVKPTCSPMKTCVQSALTMPRSSRQVGSQDMLKTGTRKAVFRKVRPKVFQAVVTSCVLIESWTSPNRCGNYSRSAPEASA